MQLNCNFCINDRLSISRSTRDELILTVYCSTCRVLELHLTQRLDLYSFHFLTGGKLSLLSSISFSYYYCMMDLSNCLGVMGGRGSITMIHSGIVSPENSNH